MNVITMVFHSRPWLLKINLEQLAKQNLKDYVVLFCTEPGYHSENIRIIKNFAKETNANIEFNISSANVSNQKAFYNIMNSYKEAAKIASEYVIVLEEDIIPTQDYIEFNKRVYEKFLSKYHRIFCVAHKRRPETADSGNPEYLIGDYQLTSPSCISVNKIKECIIPLMDDPLFFSDPVEFNKKWYPDHRNPPHHHIHHDGQLERIADKNKMFSLKPDYPRSMHIGLGGINCELPKGRVHNIKEVMNDLAWAEELLNGSVEDKYNFFKTIIDTGNVNLLKMLSTYGRDMCLVPPEGPIWRDLYLDINRNETTDSSWSFDLNNEFKTYIESFPS